MTEIKWNFDSMPALRESDFFIIPIKPSKEEKSKIKKVIKKNHTTLPRILSQEVHALKDEMEHLSKEAEAWNTRNI
jgi:hypothetical protein